LNKDTIKYPQCTRYQLVLFQRSLTACLFLCTFFIGYAQIDSLGSDTSLRRSFRPYLKADSTKRDSTKVSFYNQKSALDDKVVYEAEDSIVMNLTERKAYLYGNAVIQYQTITLKAAYIEIDFESKDLFARGIVDDSTQKYVGRPEFEDQGKIYEADTMLYNFETKKGLSFGVLTTEKDGFIHGSKVLRDSNENIYVKNAFFTTCNLPHPHFYIKSDKIKVVPKKQIVTGPANLVIEDINTPLFVPFGFFPIPEKRKHGILFPNFGESPDRGFFLRGLGYYFPINQYLDLQVKGDIYFRGSWGVAVNSNYYKRYKYRGNFGFSYNRNEVGEPEEPNYSVSNDYRLNWTFNRDAKAKPNSSFSANVNFVTSNFLKNNTSDFNDIISTNSTSSISYRKNLLNNNLNLNVTSNIYQNLSSGQLDLTLPQFTANVPRQMLFKQFNSSNKTLRSFLRNLGFSYDGTFRNEISTQDTTLISGIGEVFNNSGLPRPNTSALFSDFRNGVKHNIPISTSFKALKWVTVNPNFSFSEFWYFRTTEKTWDPTGDSVIINDNVPGFSRAYNYRTSIGLSTIIYGTKNFKKGPLRAIRHVVRPNISAVWNPDFSRGEQYGYRSYTDSALNTISYSIYENGLLGGPRGGPQGSLNFGLGNNLEIKVASKDTANDGVKKVKLIESLNINGGYNFLADSINLSNLSINANTTILNKIRMNFRTTFDPYAYDSIGSNVYKTNTFLWNRDGRLGNFTQSNLSISTNLNPQAIKRRTSDNINEEELDYINSNIENYVDFNLPWSLNITYILNTNRPVLRDPNITQSITFNGDIKLTENWKFGVSSGYDISNKELAFTSLEFFRNLHCWEMNFSWYPIQRQMFEFTIRVKSSTLQDLKLNRRRSWWDL
jgi:lipopolysaccharide assembly outer membrane protein LptD (OstA)